MRRIRYSVAMSLDGYIAGPNGESDWIVMDPELDFNALVGQFDAVLLGRHTYQAAQAYGGGAMPGMASYVCSRTLQPADCPGATLIADPAAKLPAIKMAEGKDIWLFGGGNLFANLLGLRLVDSVEVAVIPVLLGGGTPLLPGPAARAGLRLVNSRVYSATGTVALEYAVV